MATIAQNLQALSDAKDDIAAAITDKGVILPEGAGFRNFPSLIEQIETGSSSNSPNDVIFIDYDGTIVQSYSAEEFADLSALPENPTHEGLTAQGWNYTLADAKTHVAKYGELIIGQTYTTSDGKTRIYVSLVDELLSPVLIIYAAKNTVLNIDWGDGSTPESQTASSANYVYFIHPYDSAGNYVISVEVASGTAAIKTSGSSSSAPMVFFGGGGSSITAGQDPAYASTVKKVEIGNNMTLGKGAFQYCYGLSSVMIPNGAMIIPGNPLQNVFLNCYSLASIVFPADVYLIPSSFLVNCYSLTYISIPKNYTTMPAGYRAVVGAQAIKECPLLHYITLPDNMDDIRTDSFTFNKNYTTHVIIPDGITGLSNMSFNSFGALSYVVLPPNIIEIPSSFFNGCVSLRNVVIPSNVTAIGSKAFYNCKKMDFIKFEPSAPPAISAADTFTNLRTAAKILVPSGSLADYTTAENYPDPSTYTYEEY